jgi:hypothetical protein
VTAFRNLPRFDDDTQRQLYALGYVTIERASRGGLYGVFRGCPAQHRGTDSYTRTLIFGGEPRFTIVFTREVVPSRLQTAALTWIGRDLRDGSPLASDEGT